MPQTTAQKLGIKPESTVLVIGQSPEFLRDLLGELPDAVEITESGGEAALVLLFADDVASVTASAVDGHERMAATGRFWIAYRKGANRKTAAGKPAPLHRDTLQAALAPLGLDGVTLVSLDETWSAMRVKAV